MSKEAEDAAVATFLAMELHVVDCRTCRRVDAEFHAAMERRDWQETKRLSRLFCPVMQGLAERLTLATGRAFGSQQS